MQHSQPGQVLLEYTMTLLQAEVRFQLKSFDRRRTSGLQAGRDFTVGYSAGAVLDKEHRFETIRKVIAAQNIRTLEIVADVYGSLVTAGIHKAPSIKAAEAAKVIEKRLQAPRQVDRPSQSQPQSGGCIRDRAVLLERGRMIADGDPSRIGNLYHEMLFGPSRDRTKAATSAELGESAAFDCTARGGASSDTVHEATVATDLSAIAPEMTAPLISQTDRSAHVAAIAPVQSSGREVHYGLRRVEIISAHIVDADDRKVHILKSLERYRLIYRIQANEAASDVHVGFLIRDARGLEIFGWDTKSADAGALASFASDEARNISMGFTANLGGGQFLLDACGRSRRFHKRGYALRCSRDRGATCLGHTHQLHCES
jgi:Wzt C-terminal domain